MSRSIYDPRVHFKKYLNRVRIAYPMARRYSKHILDPPPYILPSRTRALARRAARRAIAIGLKRIAKRKASSLAIGHANKRRLLAYDKAKKRRYKRIVGNAAGTTHTTSRMIVRKTPRDQKFLRKIFREGEANHIKYVQRFGFSFIGAYANNSTIWYSVTHLKFNNIVEMIQYRVVNPATNVGTKSGAISANQVGNLPTQGIYLGKCTFNYELYNPTNYNITVYIYDLICKHDTPYGILYGDTQTLANSSSPEVCMQQSTQILENTGQPTPWKVADPVTEIANPTPSTATNPIWRTVGMKPTDFYYFNAMWKVKGIKKIILPPQTGHHHVVIYNPKKVINQGSFFYRYLKHEGDDKHGCAGITQSTLFGMEGQVATDAHATTDNEIVGTLPGKLLIKCIRKCNVYNLSNVSSQIIQKNQLKTLTDPEIFTDLQKIAPEMI